jgi:tetratricopeptide (TPR) repeat protein
MDQIDFRELDRFLAEAEAHFAGDEAGAALETAESRLVRLPGDLAARLVICRVRIEQGRPAEAGALVQELEEILAALSRLYVPLGDLCLEKGLRHEAVSLYGQFIRLNSGTPAALETEEKLRAIGEPGGTGDRMRADAEEAGEVPADFQTVTLADLYIRQGHLTLAADVLEAILRRNPQQEKAAQRLREVKALLAGGGEDSDGTSVAAELSRWLGNIGRLRTHGV